MAKSVSELKSDLKELNKTIKAGQAAQAKAEKINDRLEKMQSGSEEVKVKTKKVSNGRSVMKEKEKLSSKGRSSSSKRGRGRPRKTAVQ